MEVEGDKEKEGESDRLDVFDRALVGEEVALLVGDLLMEEEREFVPLSDIEIEIEGENDVD